MKKFLGDWGISRVSFNKLNFNTSMKRHGQRVGGARHVGYNETVGLRQCHGRRVADRHFEMGKDERSEETARDAAVTAPNVRST